MRFFHSYQEVTIPGRTLTINFKEVFMLYFKKRRRKISVIFLNFCFSCLLIILSLFISNSVFALDLNDDCYTTQNPYFQSGYGGQCTAFAWGRACEKKSIKLIFKDGSYPDARNWYIDGPIDSLNLKTGSIIQSDAIAVWGGDSFNPRGHVAYVEKVENGSVSFNEANVDTYTDSDWGGGYDGVEKTWPITEFEHRGPLDILGYIYLSQPPRKNLMEDIIYGLQILSGIRALQDEMHFKNITDVYLDALSSEVQANHLHLFNLRITSDNTSLDDLIKMEVTFDNDKEIFSINSVDILKGVGVYNDCHFAKDVPSEIYMYRDAQQFEMDQTHTITSSGEEYYMDLEIGQVLSFDIDDPDNDFIRKIKDPDNNEISSYIHSKGQGVISDDIPIFKTGQYTVQFMPLSSPSVKLKIRFLNANRRNIDEIYNGSYINISFKKNIRDYGKYKILLSSGELLSLDDPYCSDIKIKIVNSKSKHVAGSTGLPVKYIADSDDVYYIFIYNSKGWGESYSSTVNITSTETGKRGVLRNINYNQSDFNGTPAKQ
jgi:surface antigen